MKMTRYWFEFFIVDDMPFGTGKGCGITAYNKEDAINILKQKIFKDKAVPAFKRIIEDIDVSTLDPGHILLNMAAPNIRGVWFPLGYNY